MTRLPTIGGDTNAWGSVLNDFLDSDYGFYGLNGATAAGATSITVDRIPGIIQSNHGQFVLIDVGTTEAEIREITTVSGNTLSFTRALTYAHDDSDPVYLVGLAAQGELIPWSWWGGQSRQNTDAAATINTTAFNRLIGPDSEIYNAGRFGIFIDGTYYVNNELKPERSTAMVGETALTSSILARSGFPFTAAGDIAVIHPYRDGLPVLFEAAGPSGRWWFRNFEVNGQSLSNSNGIISSPQQPDSTENIRVRNCSGDYGLGLMDVAYHDCRNLQFDNCGTSLYLWESHYIRIYNMNFTTPSGTVGVQITNSTDTSFYGGLFETVVSGGKIFNATGSSSRLGFYDIFTSGFHAGSTGDVFYFDCALSNPSNKCTYVISNAFCNQNANTVNFVNDVQRSITFNTNTDSDRSLIFGWAQDGQYNFVLGGTTYGHGGGASIISGPVQFGFGGSYIQSGSGSPEGVYPAPVGSLFMRTNGGALTTFYVKESGTGNTGWVPK